MSGLVRSAALAVLVASPLSASAFGHRPRAVTSASYYYYPAPWVVVPEVVPVYVPVVPAPVCAPAAPAVNLAVPTPAPPTSSPAPVTPAPPSASPRPGVSETPAPSTSYYAGPGGTESNTCTVVFWNLSGRDVTLTVDGTRRPLPPGKGVTLDLPRRFTWQTENRAPQQEQVASGNVGMEIVIRR